MQQALTANRLTDGRVVFRTNAGGWTLAVREAALATDQAAADAALAAGKADEAAQVIVDPYLIDIDLSGAEPRPARLREAIRAFGPTIAYGDDAVVEAAE